MPEQEIEHFYPENRLQWRKWLAENHAKKQSVWSVYYQKKSGIPSISWSEAVEEALCFGWIDSKKQPIDHEKHRQFFSKRKAKSTWSKINKDKIEHLINAGAMAEAGLASIVLAKDNGSWTILDEVEALIIPKDLETAFKTKPAAKDFFLALSKTSQKMILQGLVLAKRSETRQARIEKILVMAS